ncbi:MAG: hypothetical protein ACRCXD_15870, partial [Luteolibacter sp.]
MENQPALPRTPLEEASDPATNGERLRELSGWRGAVGRAVASNPNSPTYVLVWIAKRYWKEVLENPVFPLLLLEDPGLPLKLPVKALREVLREWNPPGEFLHPLKRHPDAEIREAARLHVANGAAPEDAAALPLIELKGGDSLAELVEMGAAPGWLLGQALECDSAKIRARALVVICKGPDKSLHARVNLLRAAGSGGWLRAVGKGNKDLDGESLGALAAGGPYARKLSAHHPGTPPEVLEALARGHAAPALLRLLARNPATPVATLLSFALTGDVALRKAVAANRNLPAATLDQMSVDAKTEVREGVAGNPATPASVLARLAADLSKDVRCKVAKNRSTDSATLKKLVKDAEDDVRCALAKRKGCPFEILKKLARDEDRHVRFTALRNPAFPGDRKLNRKRLYHRLDVTGKQVPDLGEPPSAEEEEMMRLLGLAGEKETALEMLAELARHESAAVRKTVAGNPSTPAELLADLARDADAWVRHAVALNKLTPASELEKLAEDGEVSVRSCVASNPGLPAKWIERFSRDPNEEIRSRVPFNRSASPDLLVRMASEDESEYVHSSLRNYSGVELPEEAMLILANRCEKCCKDLERHPAIPESVMEVVIGKMTPYGRRSFLFSNGYHHRNPYPKASEPIPPRLLLKLVEVPDDKYLIRTHQMMAEVARYWAVTPEVLETMAQ